MNDEEHAQLEEEIEEVAEEVTPDVAPPHAGQHILFADGKELAEKFRAWWNR